MKCKHKNPIAAVYRLTNIVNGKIYIGESSDMLNRLSTHRCTPRRKEKYINTPIEKAIVKYSFDAFAIDLLKSSIKDPKLHDTEYRRKCEAEAIRLYHATDPDIGYNREENNKTNHKSKWTKKSVYGIKLKVDSKGKLSKNIIVYDSKDDTVTMYLGAKAYAILHGDIDRSLITSAIKHGKQFHECFFFKVDYKQRLEDISRDLKRKLNAPNIREEHMQKYIHALFRINDWCNEYGIKPVNLYTIDDRINKYI